jgi:hypothetical protein
MGNQAGTVYAFTTITPIQPDRVQPLQAYLAALSAGPDAVFSRSARTHMARWVIIDRLDYEGQRERHVTLRSPRLLFSAVVDAPLAPFLDELVDRMAPEAGVVWGHCVGCPGTDDREAFKAYLLRHQLPIGCLYVGHRDVALRDALESLELKDRLVRFAIETQGADDDALWRAYRDSFGGGAPAAQPAATAS